jgi:HTH-type transcriptional regulator / antitoxin HipB
MRIKTSRDLGLLIRDQRRAMGIRQEDLAKKIGVSRSWLIGVEQGKPRAEIGLVLRAATALGLTMDVKGVARDTERPPASNIDAIVHAARRPQS